MGNGPCWSTGVRIAVCRWTPSRTGIMTSCSLNSGLEGVWEGFSCATAMASRTKGRSSRFNERTLFLLSELG